jgi:hypothetical protein
VVAEGPLGGLRRGHPFTSRAIRTLRYTQVAGCIFRVGQAKPTYLSSCCGALDLASRPAPRPPAPRRGVAAHRQAPAARVPGTGGSKKRGRAAAVDDASEENENSEHAVHAPSQGGGGGSGSSGGRALGASPELKRTRVLEEAAPKAQRHDPVRTFV